MTTSTAMVEEAKTLLSGVDNAQHFLEVLNKASAEIAQFRQNLLMEPQCDVGQDEEKEPTSNPIDKLHVIIRRCNEELSTLRSDVEAIADKCGYPLKQ